MIIVGISTEVCLGITAIAAVSAGYDAYGVLDAIGTFSKTKRETGVLRVVQAGVIGVDYTTVVVELLKDNANPLAFELYSALDAPWAKLVFQLRDAFVPSEKS